MFESESERINSRDLWNVSIQDCRSRNKKYRTFIVVSYLTKPQLLRPAISHMVVTAWKRSVASA